MPVGATPSTSSSLSTTFDLFSSGNNISTASSIKIGDLAGALIVGNISYALIIISFFIGILSIHKIYIGDRANGTTILDNLNPAKILLKPFLFLFGGTFTLVILTNFLDYWYHIDINKWLKFFYEARYDTVVGQIIVEPKMLDTAKQILAFLDLNSKFCFYSILFIYATIIVSMVIYVIVTFSVFVDGTNEGTIAKKIFHSVMIGFVGVIILSIYSTFINQYIFKEHPNIQNIGTITDVNDANTKVLKHFAKIGLQIINP